MPKLCPEKKAYESAKAAWFFAHADGLRTYRCPLCKRWHLTSQARDRGRTRAAAFDDAGHPSPAPMSNEKTTHD